LTETNLELAEALEVLAPFGAGNPSLTFATRNVKITSVTEIGRTKEHLRLNVEDEAGNVQSILWWNGIKDDLSVDESRVDIAYSMRATTFRGEKQVSLQFEELRVVEEKPVEVRAPKLEIIDWRLNASMFERLNVETLVWAEGKDRSKGKSRFELHQADDFAIWTTPPSPADLRAALEVVKPKRVHIFGVSPRPEKADEFLARLAGMAKYVINNKEGRVSANELASALAQRESATRIGLEWLAAGGHISVVGEEDALLLGRGSGEANQYLQKELYLAVRGILEETAAYRAHFARADVHSLLSK
jgi:hypothetical protein